MRYQNAFFNTYLILKSCWVVILFNLLGYFMLAEFNQGQDVLRSLGFTSGEYQNRRHTLMFALLIFHWAWHSYRSARIITHAKAFHFSEFYRTYSLRTLVLIPRLFGIVPFLIVAYATYKAMGEVTALLLLYLTLGTWMFMFLLYRRKIIVYLMTRHLPIRFLLNYIPVKNEAYPAAFIISKQKWWIFLRIFLFVMAFVLIILFPISFSTFIGSAALVVLSLSNSLIFFTTLAIFERRFKIPFLFILFICLFVFSYFNNNHELRVLNSGPEEKRTYVDTYISKWLYDRGQEEDTVQVYLVAAEGGGIRAAYWSNEVLSELSIKDPQFHKKVLAYSAVSGGSLGTMAFNIGAKTYENPRKARRIVRNFLKSDFLSPIMAYAMFPDALQRFLPFPIESFDRATILEKTWEECWEKNSHENSNMFKEGFLKGDLSGQNGSLIFLNATHIETGKRVLVSPVKFGENQFFQANDLLSTIGKDIRVSTSILLSSRFPYITPAALIVDKENNKWGHVGDGGYYENLGISTLLDVYNRLRIISEVKKIPTKVTFIFIRNTKDFSKTEPLRSMYEFMAPIEGYLNVWYKSGGYNLNLIKNITFSENDKILNIALPRFENDIIPLGWTMSKQATDFINSQVEQVVKAELEKSD